MLLPVNELPHIQLLFAEIDLMKVSRTRHFRKNSDDLNLALTESSSVSVLTNLRIPPKEASLVIEVLAGSDDQFIKYLELNVDGHKGKGIAYLYILCNMTPVIMWSFIYHRYMHYILILILYTVMSEEEFYLARHFEILGNILSRFQLSILEFRKSLHLGLRVRVGS